MTTYSARLSASFGTGYSGLVANVLYTIYDNAGTIQVGPTGTGIAEDGTSGTYYVNSVSLDNAWGNGSVRWTITGQTGVEAWEDIPRNVQAALTDQGYTNARGAKLDDLDATISSRMASGSVTVGSYAAGEDPATLLLATPANKLATDSSGNVTVGTIASAALTALAGAVWNALTATYTTVATFGKLLGTFGFTGSNVNANAQVVADKIDYALSASEHLVVEADVQDALDDQGYTAGRASNLDDLDTTVSSRLATSGYTAPDNGDVAAIKVKTDQLHFTGTTVDADVASLPSVVADVQSGLTAQGYTTTRAGYLDTLNGLVAAIWAAATRTLTAFGFGVTVSTNNDKTGYALSSSEHLAVEADVQDALDDQGYTAPRAALLDDLDAAVSSRQPSGAVVATSVTNPVQIDTTQAVPLNSPLGSVGEALVAARADAYGWWILDRVSRTLTILAPDKATIVAVMDLDDADAPTTRKMR